MRNLQRIAVSVKNRAVELRIGNGTATRRGLTEAGLCERGGLLKAEGECEDRAIDAKWI